MFLGGRIVFMALLLLATTYTVFLLWFGTNGMVGRHWCVYAVSPIENASSGALNVTWEAYNETQLFISSPNGASMTNKFDAICGVDVLDKTAAASLNRNQAIRNRIRIVSAARNCVASIWTTHFFFASLTVMFYATFICMRQHRRMFGVFRVQKEFISPTRYPLSYAVRVIASNVAGCKYSKMARLMCELATIRSSFSRGFVNDPITSSVRHKTTAVLFLLEVTTHGIAQCCVMMAFSALHGPCAAAYPLYFKVITGIYVAIVAIVELFVMLTPGPTDKKIMVGETTERKQSRVMSGLTSVCANCCATLMSGLFVKLLHLASIIGLVFLFLWYERKVQEMLFSA
ncbi:glycoprotein K [anatid alphaherpesvirus 1]|uniref:Envelope glycoprotein K n=2 Tax=anatid alphaherpesvirus 1 TaxID=104388 RepID=A9QXU7_9ALPH|nr:envelope glycoprotein K [Anatid alphaherpesvirus 1]ABX57828.1 virion glycoprotein K [Anatid alphaherpesvirus 1]AFC61828.1 glycoprotein K [Anatid alphaherpesvirus 1]WOZ29836.1 UL53 [Anatid alphaherpesvirus 1]